MFIRGLVTCLALALSLFFHNPQRILENRLSRLDDYVQDVLENPSGTIQDFSEGMVLYTYKGDSLVRWQGEFPVLGDQLIPHFDACLSHLEFGMSSPIARLGPEYCLTQFGDKWYISRKCSDVSGYTVVAGLYVGDRDAVAPFLKVGKGITISPLGEGFGEVISYRDTPLFVLSPIITRGIMTGSLDSFSTFLFVGLCVFLLCLGLYLVHRRIRKHFPVWGVVLIFLGVAVCGFSLWATWNMISNSSISLEPLWYSGGIRYTIAALVVSTLQIGSVLFVVRMLENTATAIKGRKVSSGVISYKGISLLAIVISAIFYSLSWYEHSVEESSITRIWANRLSIGRDLNTELRLLEVEGELAADPRIPYFLHSGGEPSAIASGIQESYFQNESSSYTVKVEVIDASERDAGRIIFEKFGRLEKIAPGSLFAVHSNKGRCNYTGLFTYGIRDGKTIYMLVHLDSKIERQSRYSANVYSSLAKTSSSTVNIPRIYAYARYVDGALTNYRGSYAYPTILDDFHSKLIGDGIQTFARNRYLHFLYSVDDEQVMIISRPLRTPLMVLSGILFLYFVVLLVFLPFVFLESGNARNRTHILKGFRGKINAILTLSVVVVLACLSIVSVRFVLDKSLADHMQIMSMKVSSVESMVENSCTGCGSFRDMENASFLSSLRTVSANTDSDITLYNMSGKAFLSTATDAFESPFIRMRISSTAYDKICREHQRFYIERCEMGNVSFFNLYAPVFNGKGEMLAIICIPFSNFRRDIIVEVLPHAILLLTMSVLLLLIVVNLTHRFTDKLFEPLSEVGEKMKNASGGLEHIVYEPKDEVSALVESYNRMVDDLQESSIKLAENERDKAWSAMARQVAHEIKNPLTPIKLELQRLIYLKQKGDPLWEKKFTDISAIILDHIDILTETADEFSSFAKLYCEEPVEIDLDKMLRDQVLFFSGRQDIKLEYIGYAGAVINGPKPQLTRVFVNLMTNAVQALTIDGIENPRVMVQLRKSLQEGFWEILVEDNGHGVAAENLDKLFQPNFTTKSAGAGLGLAMCKGIVEKCGGKIFYEKSFTLGGAAFVVRLPRKR